MQTELSMVYNVPLIIQFANVENWNEYAVYSFTFSTFVTITFLVGYNMYRSIANNILLYKTISMNYIYVSSRLLHIEYKSPTIQSIIHLEN